MPIPVPPKVYNFFRYLILPSFILIFLSILWGPVLIYSHLFNPVLVSMFAFWLAVLVTVNFRPTNGKRVGTYSSGPFFSFFFLSIVLPVIVICLGYVSFYLPLTSRLLVDAQYANPLEINFQAKESDRLYFEVESGRQTSFGTTLNLNLVGPNSFSTSTKIMIAKGKGTKILTETIFSKIKIPISGSYTLSVSKDGLASIRRIRILAR